MTDADDGEEGRVICEMDSDRGMEYFKLVHNDDIIDMWYVVAYTVHCIGRHFALLLYIVHHTLLP